MMAFESMLVAFAGGICVDIVLGDPRNKFHPVAWIGHVIQYFVPKLKQNNSDTNSKNNINHTGNRKERLRSIIFSVLLIVSFGIAIHICAIAIVHTLGYIAFIFLCALTLKMSIAIKGMEKHAAAVICAVENGDLTNARFNLSMIVKRDTTNLDERHIISGTIESISENIVDGITSPLFYYSFLGPAGAFSFRIINTLDSMLGYKDKYHKDIGWMPALLDTVANYVPSRVTAVIMVIAARIVHADWKKSMQIMRRDHGKTSSRNAGYAMAAMAGALRVSLEKIDHYSLGDQYEYVSIEKCKAAISIMRCTVIAFAMIVCTPLISVLYYLGWWRIIFGI
jgi:adenosylcobinamide-phosphate synthase